MSKKEQSEFQPCHAAKYNKQIPKEKAEITILKCYLVVFVLSFVNCIVYNLATKTRDFIDQRE